MIGDKKSARLDLNTLLQRVIRSTPDGGIGIATSTIPNRSEDLKTLQRALSAEGLYASQGHRFYADGFKGEVLYFGILAKADPSHARDHIAEALTSKTSLNKNEIMKMQIALNALTSDPAKRIKVDGIVGPQTANRLADHITQHGLDIKPGSAWGKVLKKHAGHEQLEEIGLAKRKGQTATKFDRAAQQSFHLNQTEMEERLSSKIIGISRTDNANEGYCAKGVANILKSLGVGYQRGHAYTWKDTLPKHGWVKLDIAPEHAPVGSIIVYDRNEDFRHYSEGGRRYGHVEIVAERDGKRVYVSDEAREHRGGTVRENLAGVFINPQLAGDYMQSQHVLANNISTSMPTHNI